MPVVTMRSTDFSCLSDPSLMMALLTKGHRPALLVNCNGRGADAVTRSMLAWCTAPVHLIRLPGVLDLPLVNCGTLVVADAAALTIPQQIELHDWLNAGRRSVQTVSITSRPIWPLVERGRFLEGLFYRLNVVTLEANETLM
jgi:transcriptional regulator of aromatic amino acid metabolism